MEQELQSSVNSLTNGWNNAQTEASKKLFLENSSDQIINLLGLFMKINERFEQKHNLREINLKDAKHVLVIGPTGSGKSTVINYLIGNTLEVSNSGEEIIVTQNTGNGIATIGNSSMSETNTITPFYNNTCKTNTIYWDFPGFFDNHGEVRNIKNALLMTSFSKMTPSVKILLVVSQDVITAARGKGFIKLLNILSQLCDVDEIQNSLTLLITKSCRYTSQKQIKNSCIKNFNDWSKVYKNNNNHCSKLLESLCNKDMQQNIVVSCQLTEPGVIPNDLFLGLDSAINASTSANILFKIFVDDEMYKTIETLTRLLNRYAEHITQESANEKTRDMKLKIQREKFIKSDISANQDFSINVKDGEANEFVKKFKSVSCNERNADIISNIIKTLQLFGNLCHSFSMNLISWATPFNNLHRKYQMLAQVKDTTNTTITPEGSIQIKMPILLASEIQSSYTEYKNNLTKKEIKTTSILFIADQDLELPGINLSIVSHEWRAFGNIKISLKSDSNKNAGSFYSYAEKIKGGKFFFDLDGFDGNDGEFNLSQRINEIDKVVEEIEKLDNQKQAIQKLKTLMEQGSKKLKILYQEKEECLENIKSIKNEISFLSRYLIDAYSQLDPYSTKKEIESKEDKIREEEKTYETLQKDILVIEKLEELIKVKSDYNKVKPDFTVQSTIVIDQNGANELKEVINKIHTKLESFDNLLHSSQTLQTLENISKKIKRLSCKLVTIAFKYDENYRKRQEIHDSFIQKHTVFLDNTPLEISSQSLDTIKNTEKEITELIKVFTNIKKEYEKENSQLNEDIKKFYEQNRIRQEYEKQLQKERQALSQKQRNLNKEEFEEIRKKIEALTKAAINKDEKNKAWQVVVGRKDTTIPGVYDKFIQAKGELLRVVDKDKFVEDCKKQLQMLENKTKPNVQLLSYEIFKLKIQIDKLEIKKMVNTYIDRYLSVVDLKYPLSNNECDIEIQKLRSELKKTQIKLLGEDQWFVSLRIMSLNDDEIDNWVDKSCKAQEYLKKRLNDAKKYQEEIENAHKEYKTEEENYNKAINEFHHWKKIYQKKNDVDLNNYIKIYDEYLTLLQKTEKSLHKEAKIVEQLLLKKSNLVTRIERTFDDRDRGSKLSYIVKELFLFNRQYYEKYKLAGSNGSDGSNSGGYKFINGAGSTFEANGNYVGEVKNKPGKGGKNAIALEGTYINEYSFPLFRGIKPKQDLQDIKDNYDFHGAGAIYPSILSGNFTGFLLWKTLFEFTDDAIVQATTKGALVGTTVGVSLGISAGMILLQCLLSPLVAKASSHWCDGPYKYDTGKAKDGINSCSEESQEWLNEGKKYLATPKMKDLLPFFSFV